MTSSSSSSSSSTITTLPPSQFRSWISILSLLILVQFFRSIAAPFLNPKSESRLPFGLTSGHIQITAFLYLWLSSVTMLTILPHVSSHSNAIIAASFFFPVWFVSVVVLLLGRFMIRLVYYLRVTRRHNTIQEKKKEEEKKKKEVEDGEKGTILLPPSSSTPKLIAFHRPFRRLIKSSLYLSIVFCVLYAHCWSREFTAFKLYGGLDESGGGAICKIAFLPFIIRSGSSSKVTTNQNNDDDDDNESEEDDRINRNIVAADESSILILWASILIAMLFNYAMNEFAGRHHVKKERDLNAVGSSGRVMVGNSNMIGAHHKSLASFGEFDPNGNSYDDDDDDDEDEDEDDEDEEDTTTVPNTIRNGTTTIAKATTTAVNNLTSSWRRQQQQQQYRDQDEEKTPTDTLAMASWYSFLLFISAFDILVQLLVFLGRYDARTMQPALHRAHRQSRKRSKHEEEDDDGDDDDDDEEFGGSLFDFRNASCQNSSSSNNNNGKDKDGFWFDFMSDCGDGFNPSYQIARMLAQPKLVIHNNNKSSSSFTSSIHNNNTNNNNNNSKKTLPRGSMLVIGGDLAYPDPTPYNYERRFFRTFEDALEPPPCFRRSAISIHKPDLPVKGWRGCFSRSAGGDDDAERKKTWCDSSFLLDGQGNQEDASGVEIETEGRNEQKQKRKRERGESKQDLLKRYKGPCAFVIPGNHDWFDGLATYTRFILSRNWLGGWLMPQKRSYFAISLPNGWWVLGFDLALASDIDIDQFKFFAKVAKTRIKPSDAVIVVNHEPTWVLDHAARHHHNSSSHTATTTMTESNLRELMDVHLAGKVRLRLAGDLHHYTRHVPESPTPPPFTPADGTPSSTQTHHHDNNSPELIVSGGGGAFLHGTHTFDRIINVGPTSRKYFRTCAFPNETISYRLAWLNIWQFRWRNWRLDIIWAVAYFLVSSSLFPMCGIYPDYLESVSAANDNNEDISPVEFVLWVGRTLLTMFGQVFLTGRVSLLFSLLLILVLFLVTDYTMPPASRMMWGCFHGLVHIFTSLACLLFVETMSEWTIYEGIVKINMSKNLKRAVSSSRRRNNGGINAVAADGMDLASSLYREYNDHIGGALLPAAINATTSFVLTKTSSVGGGTNPNVANSINAASNFSIHEKTIQAISMLSQHISSSNGTIPFIRTAMSLFDLPGQIAQKHANLCEVLCSSSISSPDQASSSCTIGHHPIHYQMLDRSTLFTYLIAIGLYYVVFAIPLAGNVFGAWLALTLNWFKAQYNEGFSSLRIQHWKNFLRLHVKQDGDLEVYAIGLHRVPKQWVKDPLWDGRVDARLLRRRNKRESWSDHRHNRGEDETDGMGSLEQEEEEPSWNWKYPSKWIPKKHSKKHVPHLIDYTCISKRGVIAGRHKRANSFDNGVGGGGSGVVRNRRNNKKLI